jgi:3-phenylpropionate/trans-cinnamate dioxygenase ferredoxin reductase component
MAHYKYLIVGGGMTADAAVRGIRSSDPSGGIGLISSENVPPYNRPPLSKSLWKGKPLEQIWRGTKNYNVGLHLGRTAVHLDPQAKKVTDQLGNAYNFDSLLLATGGSPRMLKNAPEGIIYFRTLDDYQRLRAAAEKNDTVAIIGGGFIGSEVAAGLASIGKKAVMIFPEDGICARIFPNEVSQFIDNYYIEKGVTVLNRHKVERITEENGIYSIHIEHGEILQAGAVVAGIGLTPNTALAQEAGIEVGDGILVDPFLQTSAPDIYAAGDVARFYNPALGQSIRLEHEDNANSMGEMAGFNMAGGKDKYTYLPYFYSDLFDIGYEAIGELSADMETYADWDQPYAKGVIYYLRDGRVRGVLLWNVWKKVQAARELITAGKVYSTGELKGMI